MHIVRLVLVFGYGPAFTVFLYF